MSLHVWKDSEKCNNKHELKAHDQIKVGLHAEQPHVLGEVTEQVGPSLPTFIKSHSTMENRLAKCLP